MLYSFNRVMENLLCLFPFAGDCIDISSQRIWQRIRNRLSVSYFVILFIILKSAERS